MDSQAADVDIFASNVRLFAAKQGLNASRIAEAIDIPASSASNYWSGKRPWPIENVNRLADLLQVSVDDLFGRKGVHGVIALPVAVGAEASAGAGTVPLDYEEMEPVPFPEKWLRGLGDPKNMALIKVSGDSMFPKILHGDMVIFDRTRRGPGDGIYLIRHEGTLMVKQICFFDAEIRIRSENKHWPEVPVPYSAMEDPSLFEVIGRVVWAGRLLTAAGDL